MKKQLKFLVATSFLLGGLFPSYSSAEEPQRAKCTLTIESDKHTKSNYANATGVCKDQNFGYYASNVNTFNMFGMYSGVVKNGQTVVVSVLGSDQYVEADLTVYTVLKSTPPPAPSTTQPKPSTPTTQPKPSTSTTQPKPSTSTTQPKPSTSTAQPKPSTSTAQPKPSTSTAQPKPSTSTAQPKPSTSTAQPKPSTSTAQPKPSTSTAQPKPSTSTAQPKPSTSTAQPKPSTSTAQPKPSEKEAKAEKKDKDIELASSDVLSVKGERKMNSWILPFFIFFAIASGLIWFVKFRKVK